MIIQKKVHLNIIVTLLRQSFAISQILVGQRLGFSGVLSSKTWKSVTNDISSQYSCIKIK